MGRARSGKGEGYGCVCVCVWGGGGGVGEKKACEKRKLMCTAHLSKIILKLLYYPVDISTTVFSYSRAVQYHTILHGAGVIARALGLCGILATTMCFN